MEFYKYFPIVLQNGTFLFSYVELLLAYVKSIWKFEALTLGICITLSTLHGENLNQTKMINIRVYITFVKIKSLNTK